MPKLPPYSYNGPVDCTVAPDLSKLKNKSVVVTGGADGIGECIVRGFAAAGAFVTFGDVQVEKGENLAKELGQNVCFVKCDIREWEQQVQLFETAVSRSPQHSCDIVVANAGILRLNEKSLWHLDDPQAAPVKPDFSVIEVNGIGTMYTVRLATHYFRAQADDEDRDRCILVTGSLAAYVATPADFEYNFSKGALRGLLKSFRLNSHDQGIRMNMICPAFVKRNIRSPERDKFLESCGVDWASPDDVAAAMMFVACDRTINGHSFSVVSHSVAKEGFLDTENDDGQAAPAYHTDIRNAVAKALQFAWEVK